MSILSEDKIILNAPVATKREAIELAGRLLVQAGHVEPDYIQGMLSREATLSTYVGSGVAIPHGQQADLARTHSTGISVVQIPGGIRWNEDEAELVYLVIGLAANGPELEGMLSKLVELLHEPAQIRRLAHTGDPREIMGCLM